VAIGVKSQTRPALRCVVSRCNLNDGTKCYRPGQGTILSVGDVVRTICLVVAEHIHLVINIQVPVSTLSKRLAFVELFMTKSTSSLLHVFPSVPRL
jgi:hypothetical protein